MASILALPRNVQTIVVAALDVGDCTRFSVALGRAFRKADRASSLLSIIDAADFPWGYQPSPAVWMELSELRVLKLRFVYNLDPCRFFVCKQLAELEVGLGLDAKAGCLRRAKAKGLSAFVSNSMVKQVSNSHLLQKGGFVAYSIRSLNRPQLLD